MRKIGQLRDERQARLFGDALYARGVENDVETEEDGAFSIWVHDDDQLQRGRELLERFVLQPEAAEWQGASSAAAQKRKAEEKSQSRKNANVITRERIDYERNFTGFAWVPMILAILSIAATIWAGDLGLSLGGPASGRGDVEEIKARRQRADYLFIENSTAFRSRVMAERMREVARDEGLEIELPPLEPRPVLAEVKKGEVWRLFTPMFLHFGILHLLFNIMWLRDLGGFMQHRFGALYLIVFVLTVAAVSNVVQLAWTGPMFGGLSGVNYGLLGFLWMRGRFDRGGFWQLNPQIVQWMIAWFVLCFFLPGVANGAHAAGLLFGMLAGFVTAKIANARRARV